MVSEHQPVMEPDVVKYDEEVLPVTTAALPSTTDMYEYEIDPSCADVGEELDGSIGSQAIRYGDSGLDWNRNFQAQLDALHEATHVLRGKEARESKAEAIEQLAKLGNDFVLAAELYAKVIISEVTLPAELKTVRPLNSGNLGRAGGEKYIARGILLKLAIDDKGIYGGNDAAAAKVAGHELLSLCQIYHYSAPGLYFPICATFDYLGYRVLASSILPISTRTLRYGSEDGVVVYNADEKLCALMTETCGNRLNLKEHLINGLRLHSPTDLEGHLGRDDRYYVIDLSRLFPPTSPDASLRDAGRNSYLYRLFRPEFVRGYSKPLCSDAYSKFGGRSINRRHHDPEIDSATEYLKTHTIPVLASEISNSTVEDDEIRVPRLLHGHGVNLRYGGLVWNLLERRQEGHGTFGSVTDDDCGSDNSEAWKAWLLVEMCARVAKNDIHALLRSYRKEHRSAGEEPYKQVVANYLTTSFCSANWEYLSAELKARYYFGEALTAKILKHIMCDTRICTPSRYSHSYSTLEDRAAPLGFYFLRLEELGGFHSTPVLKRLRLAAFARGQLIAFPCVSEEITFACRVKHLSIIQYCKSVCYRKLVEEASILSPQEKSRILGLALYQLERVLDCVPQYAWALRCRAEVLEDMGLPERAEGAYRLASKWGRGPSSTIKYALFLAKHGRYIEALKMCSKGLLKDPDNDRGRKTLAVCLEEHAMVDTPDVDDSASTPSVGVGGAQIRSQSRFADSVVGGLLDTELFQPLQRLEDWSPVREQALRDDVTRRRIAYRLAVTPQDDIADSPPDLPCGESPEEPAAALRPSSSGAVQVMRISQRRFSLGTRDSSSPELLSFIVDAYRRPKEDGMTGEGDRIRKSV